MGKTIKCIGVLMELTGVAGLAAIAFKRNNDAYKAAVKCIDLERDLHVEKLKGALKDMEILLLKDELKTLKKLQQQEKTEES